MLIEPHPEAGLRDLFLTEMIGQIQNSGQETCAYFACGFANFSVKLVALFDDKYPQRRVLPFQQKRSGSPSDRSSNHDKVVGRLHADTKIRFCARLFKTYPSRESGRDELTFGGARSLALPKNELVPTAQVPLGQRRKGKTTCFSR
jgi:hypothetical protein